MPKNLSAQVIFLGKTIAKRRMICYNKSVQKFIPERVIIMPTWLNDAVFYEIYPQSFYDSNGDGIGDLQGIIEKLDYVKELGCNALWLNPVYDSPFMDAGYDVRDYKKVAPRYGTNEDLVRLFECAHAKGIKVLLDLVPKDRLGRSARVPHDVRHLRAQRQLHGQLFQLSARPQLRLL